MPSLNCAHADIHHREANDPRELLQWIGGKVRAEMYQDESLCLLDVLSMCLEEYSLYHAKRCPIMDRLREDEFTHNAILEELVDCVALKCPERIFCHPARVRAEGLGGFCDEVSSNAVRRHLRNMMGYVSFLDEKIC